VKQIGSTTRLNNGVEIPWLGLGVYQTRPGEQTQRAVRSAIECGYRLIDTARAYRNESDVGDGVRSSGIDRKQIFVTTKVWNSDHGYDATIHACKQSIQTLGLGPIDLYLIHWPVEGLRHETWRAMTTLLEEGHVRAIGVSNYTIRHLEQLFEHSKVVPAVNQVEFNPFLYQKELLAFCQKHGIQLEAYGPVTQGKKLGHPAVGEIAERLHKSSAQVMLRWALQHETVVIPKSADPGRIKENAQVFDFELAAADMAKLDALDENFRTSWDPTHAP
jgi:diketogulonate reductase-like aldo/keto reductase